MTDPGNWLECRNEEWLLPGEDRPELAGPGVAVAAGDGAQQGNAQPAGAVVVSEETSERGADTIRWCSPEVHRKISWANVEEVEETELQSHAAITQDLEPVPPSFLLEILLKSSLDIGLEFCCLARAGKEGNKAEEEAVVGESEDEPDDEGEESAAGCETPLVVAPAHHDHRDQGGGDPAQGRDGRSKQLRFIST